MSQEIILQMNNGKKPSSKQETNKLYDYIFCVFLWEMIFATFSSYEYKDKWNRYNDGSI